MKKNNPDNWLEEQKKDYIKFQRFLAFSIGGFLLYCVILISFIG